LDKVEKIGDYAFNGSGYTYKLMSPAILTNIKNIGSYAFNGSGITKLILGNDI